MSAGKAGRGGAVAFGAALALALAALASGMAAGAEDAPAFRDVRSGDPDGRMVILIPGLASSGDVWAETAAALADHDVHTLTLAGFAGQPARTPPEPVIAGAAEAVAALLQTEGAQGAALIGHSLGAQVALQAAALAPERVGQVVVVDSAPFYAGIAQPGATPEQAAAFAGAASAQLSAMSRAAFDAGQAAGMAIYSKDPAYVRTLAEWSAASDQATVIAGFAEVAGGDYRGVLLEVTAPILVLAAWDPAMGMSRDALESAYRDQYAGAPQAEIVMIEDSFHFIMHDQTAAFLDAVTGFLDGAD